MGYGVAKRAWLAIVEKSEDCEGGEVFGSVSKIIRQSGEGVLGQENGGVQWSGLKVDSGGVKVSYWCVH